MLDEGTTHIRRVRSRQRDSDALALQLRLRALLDTADLRPASLPRHALVLIRSLRAALPVYRDAPPSVWQPLLSAAVAHIVRDAARPASGPIPSDAAAVMFADRSELLACLARDWCAGLVATRWWWRSLLNGSDVEQWVLHAWIGQPRYVPAALERLAVSRDLDRFVAALPTAACDRLVGSLLETFGLSDLSVALAPMLRSFANTSTGNASGTAGQRQDDPAAVAWSPIVSRVVPELSGGALPRVQHVFVALGLLLARAPSLVRSPELARALAASLSSPVPSSVASAAPAAIERVESRQSTRDRAETVPRFRDRAVWREPRRRANRRRPARLISPRIPLRSPDDIDMSPAEVPQTALPSRSASPAERRSPTPGSQPASPGLPGTSAPTVESDATLAASAATAYGGVFYLINLALHLDLYADFTQPLTPGLALPIWDWLALSGVALAGNALRADPIWPLLASLAQREPHTQPGADFDPPCDWRVPPAWLDAFPTPVVWRWWTTNGRLRVRHPAGFLLLDVPLQGSPRTQLDEELASYSSGICAGLHRAPIRSNHRTPLRRWLGSLVGYMRVRLARSLGLPDAVGLPDLLLRQSARIAVSPGHLDVYLALADLPIAVRLAGLDRDPGWVPAAGRAIAFHFET